MWHFLTPFSSSRQHLKRYWWHRLLVVVFAVVVFSTGVCVWQAALQEEVGGYSSCIQISIDAYDDGTYTQSQYVAEQQQCSVIYPIHALLDFSFGLLAALATFYILQLIYYKVILYIVFGST
jgi:hypothetical protein